MSELLGKGTIDKKSSGETKGRQGSSSRNYDVLGRELFTPDEVRKLDNKKCIIFIRGFDPIMDNKFMYHLYIFDIEMPEMNGLQLAKEIRKIDAKALFVFLTGYTQYVMDVFEVITFDYISKPITVEKLESVLLKAMQYLHMIKRDFVFQFRKNQFRISCDDIVYFEKKGRQAVIHTISENFKANMTTEEIWKQLDDKVFAHIHVSYIINLGHIRAIDGDEVVMDNEERLLIARSHKQNLKEKHMEFVRRMV